MKIEYFRKQTVADAVNAFKGKPQLFGFDSALSLLLFRANGEDEYDEVVLNL